METALNDNIGSEYGAPMDVLAALFDARGCALVIVGERINIDEELGGEIQGAWVKYQLRAVLRPQDGVLQLICLPDIRVSKEQLMPAYELLSLVNEQVWLGHFDIWSQGRVLVYRHGALLADDGMLSISQAQALIENAVDECDRFYPAFQFVLWGNKSPEDALEAAMIDAAGEA